MAQNGDKWQKVTVRMWGCGGGGEGQGKDDFRAEVAEWPESTSLEFLKPLTLGAPRVHRNLNYS